jgi:hypothetical protein
MPELDPKSIAVLDELAESSNAQIVICSAARFTMPLEAIKQLLLRSDSRSHVCIIGTLDPEIIHRGKATRAWLDTHPDVKHYLIIDDEAVHYTHDSDLDSHCIRICSRSGLGDCLSSALDKALKLLGATQ